MTVYRKPMHTDRLLDQSSYNPTSHRATTVRTLTRRAQIFCDSADSLRDENEHLRQIFHKNDYSDEFIDTNYYKQNKQNDDFELHVTKDRFYKACGTLPTKTPTDFDKYVTAALLTVYKLVTDLQSFTLMMASAQVVETSVNTNNSPSQDYNTNPDDHSNHNIMK